MTFREAKAQYVLGLIPAFKYKQILSEAIRETTDQKELVEIFWMLIDWEQHLKNIEKGVDKQNPDLKYAHYLTICIYHLDACKAFQENKHAPTYLQKIIKPLANTRPLSENLENLYPRP